MQPLTWARVNYTAAAWRAKQQMSDEERALLDRAIAFIKHGPEDGIEIGRDDDDRTVIRQISVRQVHVQYTVTFWQVGRVLLITTIEIRHWEPLDDGPTLGTKRRRRR